MLPKKKKKKKERKKQFTICKEHSLTALKGLGFSIKLGEGWSSGGSGQGGRDQSQEPYLQGWTSARRSEWVWVSEAA
jgi:hypothetical protein